MLIITALMYIERDLQKTVDSIKMWMDSVSERLDEWREARLEKKTLRVNPAG